MEPNASNLHSHCVEITMEVHKVVPPPHRSTFQKFKTRLKEPSSRMTLCANSRDSHQEEVDTWSSVCFSYPSMGSQLQSQTLQSDIVSGLTIASLAIPQGISYAKLANLPPIVGLCYSYWIHGWSCYYSLSATAESPPWHYAFHQQMGLVPVLGSVFHNTAEWSWQTIVMGSASYRCFCWQDTLYVIRFLSLFNHEHEETKSVLGLSRSSSCFCHHLDPIGFAFKAQHHGISIVSFLIDWKLQEGLNPPSWNMLHFHGSYLGLVMKTGLVTGIISLLHGLYWFLMVQTGRYCSGKDFAALKGYKVDGNKEMMAIGLMNIVGSSTSCYVTTGAFSRSAGLAIAVGISIFKVLLQVTRPRTGMLGNIPGTDIYRNIHHYKDGMKVPGFLILSIDASINFANTTYLNERILRWVEEYEAQDAEEEGKSTHPPISVSTIDTSGVSIFSDLKKALEKKGLEANGVGEPGG
ncbi:putative sulfate transporter 3.3 [Vitis vinifera]|uniref:Putative sulfate transporter 3.3 n=1 Tax=Vitis vinifera TaxID=29760 RepID=A0A438C1B3_VITVI|nr:putative sulfate transporter 3.3 [Vitis vinifera]